MNIELKLCPFCGSGETHIADDLVVLWGACLNCGATSSVSSYESGAAEEWNRRAELADAQAEIARLRGALESVRADLIGMCDQDTFERLLPGVEAALK